MAHHLPLDDVKVLDFMWVLAGPGVTRSLADYGATVVRVEASGRPDPTRTVGPFLNNETNPEKSGLFGNNNAGKLSITLDLAKPSAREVVHDLVRWADVVSESFSPKAMRAWGFDYESLRQIKPDIIMISSCLMGQTGPLSRFAGFGNLAAALIGFYNLVGWPDRPPSGPFSAYTDYIAPRFGLVAVMAALIHRRLTGEGQYIDQAQAESSLHFLTLPLLDCAVNGRVSTPVANYDAQHAPHGVYPASGEDQWVAVASRTEAHWQALCRAMDRPDLARDPRFAAFAGRQANRAELDAIIGEWTARRPPRETEQALQEFGVPAYAVQNAREMYTDAQVIHRRQIVEVPHPVTGKTWIENSRFKLSRTPATVERAAPTVGQHTQYVLEEVLGYGEDRINQLAVEGALS
ncbi:MAG: CoA transferase [Candidatus Binataceae bacterium]|jgi:crotonobetainyl-CoA:carnitine CoA-transferase CaiB-like acyl-CoA transferase